MTIKIAFVTGDVYRTFLASNTYCLPCGPAKVTVPGPILHSRSSRLEEELDPDSEALLEEGTQSLLGSLRIGNPGNHLENDVRM